MSAPPAVLAKDYTPGRASRVLWKCGGGRSGSWGKRGGVERAAGGVAAEGQGEVEVSEKIKGYIPYTLFAPYGEPPHVQSSEQDGFGAEGKRLKNVGATADAAIKQDRNAAVYLPDDGGERIEGGNGSVYLAASLVGNNDGIHASLRAAGRNRGIENAPEEE